MAYANGKKALIRLINERNGGVGAIISNRLIDKLNLKIGDKIKVEALISDNRGNKEKADISVEVVHIQQDESQKDRRVIGLKYTDNDAQKLTLNNRGFTVN